jgi:hypothetical protein
MNTRTVLQTTHALTLAALLSLGLLAGCATAPQSETTDTAEEAAQEQQDSTTAETEQSQADESDDVTATDDAGDATDADATQGDTEGIQTSKDDPLVQTADFTFTIPEYWLGRVACHEEQEGETSWVAISLPGNPDATLATLSYVEGEESMFGGDIAYHLAGEVKAGDHHVEVWTTNWPWLVAAGDTEGLTEAELRELVDLSTGGAYDYKTVVTMSENDVEMREYEFTSSTLVPSVALG